MRYSVRDEYRTKFGRQVLTVWSPPFASTWEADALALPKGDGFMVTAYNGDKVRVVCESPRTEDNYTRVDDAIGAALNAHHDAAGRRTLP